MSGILLYSKTALLWTDWVPVSTEDVKLLFFAAGFVCFAYWLSVLLMRNSDISFVAPFRYTGLLWALLVGCWVFEHFPDGFTPFDAGIIIVSGLYMIWRESKFKRLTKPRKELCFRC